MLNNIMFYLMFARRAMIIATFMLLIGSVLFKIFIPDSYIINGVGINFLPTKKVLGMGYLIVTVITFFKVWGRDYKYEYIPSGLR